MRHIALRAILILLMVVMVRLLIFMGPEWDPRSEDRGSCFTRASRRYSTVADVLVLVFSSTLTAGDSPSGGTSAEPSALAFASEVAPPLEIAAEPSALAAAVGLRPVDCASASASALADGPFWVTPIST